MKTESLILISALVSVILLSSALLVGIARACTTISVCSAAAANPASPQCFRLLAVERMYDSCNMQSAQLLIKSLLQYQNWNNSTDQYVSYVHLLSGYTREEVDPSVQSSWRGFSAKFYVESEIMDFLAQSQPGDVVVIYYCGHGDYLRLSMDLPIDSGELAGWLSLGGLSQAYVTVILDTCRSGSWIADGDGGVIGADRTVLASCLSQQTSWGFCEWWSWFTYVGLVEGFSLANDTDNDGWLSASEVFAYAGPATEQYASEFGERQTPVSYYGQLQGNVPLIQRDTSKPFPVWDLAVTSLSWEPLSDCAMSINVTVRNRGERGGDFRVVVYADTTVVGIWKAELAPDESMPLAFVWNTTNARSGIYTLSATVAVGPGESDTSDNTLVDGIVKIGCGDMNGDFKVNIADIVMAASLYGSSEGDPDWNPKADLAPRYGVIDILDLVTVAYYYGET